MTPDWDRLAAAIRRRRIELGKSQQQLADAAGVTRTTIKNLEGARRPKRVPSSITAIEAPLLWKPGSSQALLEGREPEPADDPRAAESNGRYVRVEIDDVDEIIRDVVRGVVVKVAPNAPLSEVIEAEELVLRILQEHGLLDTGAAGADAEPAQHATQS